MSLLKTEYEEIAACLVHVGHHHLAEGLLDSAGYQEACVAARKHKEMVRSLREEAGMDG